MGGSQGREGREVCGLPGLHSLFGASSDTNGVHASPVRVVVTGASGLLGRQIMKELDKGAWLVRGLYSTRGNPDLVHCDLLQAEKIEELFKDFAPHVVIHSAAERRPDVVFKKPEMARILNIDVTKNLAEACRRHCAWMIFLSTDYIFDGLEPPYKTDAEPHPLSLYGEQKLAGERICAEKSSSSTVLRIPLLYGPMEYLKESGVTSMYEEMRKGMTKADHLQKRYPTYTCDVAKIIQKMLDVHFNGVQDVYGIFHWQASECFTKYEMVQVIASIMEDVELEATYIEACKAAPVFPVPPDSRLDCSRLEQELGIDASEYRTPFREALGGCLRNFEDKTSPPLPVSPPRCLRASIGKDERERILASLGASEELALTVHRTLPQGEMDAEDFKKVLGAPMHTGYASTRKARYGSTMLM